MKCNSIIILLLFFNCFLVIIGAALIENQIAIKQTNYSIIFDSNPSKCNIITLGKIEVIDKLTGDEINNINFDSFLPPLTILKVNSGDYYLITGNFFYTMELNQNNEIQSLVVGKNFTEKFLMKDLFDFGKDSYGFFLEKFNPSDSPLIKGKRVIIEPDELVLFDVFYDNVYFYFLRLNDYFGAFNHDFNGIENHISCVLIDSAEYACVFRQNDAIQLGTFIFQYKSESEIKEIICNQIFNISTEPIHDFAVLKDISDNRRKKILCIREKNTFLIKCNYSEISIQEIEDNSLEPSIQYHSSINNIELNEYYESLSFNMDNCYFTGFYQEYLFCCGEINKITCHRFTKEFNLINTFNFTMDGNNKDLIILNNIDYASLFYINEKGEEAIEPKLYEYFIYPPKCKNITADLYISKDFHKKINEFIHGKENIKYSFKFENLPSEFGTIYLGSCEISENIISETELQEFFDFHSSNTLLIGQEISIIYNVSLITYWSVCEIKLKNGSCYNSCENCSLGVINSSVDNHYCLACKNNYYPFSHNENNCYSKEEVRINHTNWYFNEDLGKFDLCNSSCSTCSGPSEKDCLSCSAENYLYNNMCLDNCPEQTFPSKNENEQNICLNCYENCKTCNDTGNSTEMFCTSCFFGYIKEGNNY